MSQLLNKADSNKQAAKILVDKGLHAPSVHCAYYNCLQYMLHLALNKFGLTQDKMERDRRHQRIGTHKYIFQVIKDKLHTVDKSGIVDFERLMAALKRKRIRSDYHNIKIQPTDSDDALKISEKLRSYLKEKLA